MKFFGFRDPLAQFAIKLAVPPLSLRGPASDLRVIGDKPAAALVGGLSPTLLLATLLLASLLLTTLLTVLRLLPLLLATLLSLLLAALLLSLLLTVLSLLTLLPAPLLLPVLSLLTLLPAALLTASLLLAVLSLLTLLAATLLLSILSLLALLAATLLPAPLLLAVLSLLTLLLTALLLAVLSLLTLLLAVLTLLLLTLVLLTLSLLAVSSLRLEPPLERLEIVGKFAGPVERILQALAFISLGGRAFRGAEILQHLIDVVANDLLAFVCLIEPAVLDELIVLPDSVRNAITPNRPGCVAQTVRGLLPFLAKPAGRFIDVALESRHLIGQSLFAVGERLFLFFGGSSALPGAIGLLILAGELLDIFGDLVLALQGLFSALTELLNRLLAVVALSGLEGAAGLFELLQRAHRLGSRLRRIVRT
ncbi:MAG TPA: hypothetical protein VFV34_14765 [Blastocatellia bacterium]|nr:hypothetical protein [Blastocatellia bacterium]